MTVIEERLIDFKLDLDWLVTLGPFLILGGIAWCAVRRSRKVRRL